MDSPRALSHLNRIHHRPALASRWTARNVVLGVVGGVIGGSMLSIVGVSVATTPETLVKTGLVPPGSAHPFRDCVAVTHWCLVYPLGGVPLGAGVALAISLLHGLSHWQHFVDTHVHDGKVVRWAPTLRRILVLSGVASIPAVLMFIPVPFVVAAALRTGLERTIPDMLSLVAGVIGAVAGALVGLLVLRVGISIPPVAD